MRHGAKLEKAKELIWNAWESDGPEKVRLAREALKISPDCADAYIILAELTSPTLQDKLNLYEQATRAGERAIGYLAFVQRAGSFWGTTWTRPYMHARLGYARCLEQLGRRHEALKHYAEMLYLNPRDNQGVRYLLASGLLAEGDFMTFDKYFGKGPVEQTAFWLYPRALWRFQQSGGTRRSTLALKKAMRQNPHVPKFLLGTEKIPETAPESYKQGDEDEAIGYVHIGYESWRKTRKALDWLALHTGKSGMAAGSSPRNS